MYNGHFSNGIQLIQTKAVNAFKAIQLLHRISANKKTTIRQGNTICVLRFVIPIQ